MVSREELQNQVIRLRAEKQCGICLNTNKNTVFGCGHGACQSCAELIEECHICRNPISMQIPFYW